MHECYVRTCSFSNLAFLDPEISRPLWTCGCPFADALGCLMTFTVTKGGFMQITKASLV